MVGQIDFMGKKSYNDYNFLIDDICIGNPSPNVILDSVPYQNGVYDFSEISGDVTYTTREIKLKLMIEEYIFTQIKLNVFYYKVIDWLHGKYGELKISWIDGIFKARCTSISDMNLLEDERVIEVTFLCQPFRNMGLEGNNIWDSFNFETDILQDVSYLVVGTKKINIYSINAVRPTPTIKCDSVMSILFKGNFYSLVAGSNINIIKLDKGENEIVVTGNGTIAFEWEREVV